MRKLMIATAALCAAVSVSALESANVVGYSTVDPEAGFKNMTGVAFCNTSGTALDIQDIRCFDGTSADPGNNTFRMWWYDQTTHKYVYADYTADAYADDGEEGGDGTEYTDKYYWVTTDDMFIYAPLGWKHDSEATATIEDHEKTFAAGEGFFIQPNGALAAPKVTVAGQVVGFGTTAEYATVELEAGFKNLVTCPFPAALDIQDIRCFDGESADPGNNTFRMWWYDQATHKYVYADYTADAYADDGEEGGDGTEYTDKYYWVTTDDMFIYAPLGWKHDSEAPATIEDHEKAFAAGEGFFIQPNGALSDPKVAFKNPFYVAE